MVTIKTRNGEQRTVHLEKELSVDDMKRIAGRQWAQEAVSEARTEGGEYLVGFERCIKVEFEKLLTPAGSMTRPQATKFERQIVQFGKYHGKPWGEVPTEYIVWLVDQQKELVRYVKSELFKERND